MFDRNRGSEKGKKYVGELGWVDQEEQRCWGLLTSFIKKYENLALFRKKGQVFLEEFTWRRAQTDCSHKKLINLHSRNEMWLLLRKP